VQEKHAKHKKKLKKKKKDKKTKKKVKKPTEVEPVSSSSSDADVEDAVSENDLSSLDRRLLSRLFKIMSAASDSDSCPVVHITICKCHPLGGLFSKM